jgi:hypothetical protein
MRPHSNISIGFIAPAIEQLALVTDDGFHKIPFVKDYRWAENKKPEASLRFRPMPFRQRTNTPCYLAIPTRGFTAAVRVFMGTPSAKPLNCKFRQNDAGAVPGGVWIDPTGWERRLPCAIFNLSLPDIIKTSRFSYSQVVHLSLVTLVHGLFSAAGKTKNPAYLRVSRVRKTYFNSLPAYTRAIRISCNTLASG